MVHIESVNWPQTGQNLFDVYKQLESIKGKMDDLNRDSISDPTMMTPYEAFHEGRRRELISRTADAIHELLCDLSAEDKFDLERAEGILS